MQQAAEGKERCEKRRVLASVDRYDGIGSWPRVHCQRESLPKVAVACGDRSHGNWRVPGGDGRRGGCRRSVCHWQASTLTATPDFRTVICPRRPLTPSTAPGRARAARGQQRGTIYWQTGRVCLQPGGLLCGSRPPPQLKGWRSGWTPPARTRRAKGNGHRTLPAAPIFPVAPGAGYEGALSFILCYATSSRWT